MICASELEFAWYIGETPMSAMKQIKLFRQRYFGTNKSAPSCLFRYIYDSYYMITPTYNVSLTCEIMAHY